MIDTKTLYNTLDKSLEKQTIATYNKGDIAEGVVQKLGETYIVITIDSAFDAVVPHAEISKHDLESLKVGDTLKVFVLKPEDEHGSMIVSQKRTTTGQRWDMLQEAYKEDKIIEVTVVEANNGGVLVNTDGVTGFIPTSQLDPAKVYKMEVENVGKEEIQKELSRRLSELVGKKMNVKIVEVDKEKNRVIFSEKLALSEQSVEKRTETIKKAKVGDVMSAYVTAVTPYGIFVNAEGLDGLVHVSEISWDKVENTGDFAQVGDQIKVRLIDIDEEGKRVAYSIKQLSDDPWNDVAVDYKVGEKIKGAISEIEDYGVIIKIGNGVTGLIHKSELSNEKIGDPRDHFKVGDEVEAVILTISPSERKMGMSIKRLLPERAPKKGGTKSRKTPGKSTKAVSTLDIAGAMQKAGFSVETEEDVTEEIAEKEEKPKKKAKETVEKEDNAKAEKETEAKEEEKEKKVKKAQKAEKLSGESKATKKSEKSDSTQKKAENKEE